jgi:hypothetical protein
VDRVELERPRELRSGQDPRAGTGHEARGKRQTQLVEKIDPHDICVQARAAFEEHRPEAGAMKVVECEAEIYPIVPRNHEISHLSAPSTRPFV